MLAVIAAALIAGCGPKPSAAGAPAAPQPLEPASRVALSGVMGQPGRMALDAAAGRLYVVAPANSSVEVVNLATGQRMASIGGLYEPRDVVVSPKGDRVAVTCSDGSVRFYDRRTLAHVWTLELRGEASGLRIDPASGNLLAGSGTTGPRGAELTVIDPAECRRVGGTFLRELPASFEPEGAGGRIFVNQPGTGEVAVVDCAKSAVVARWQLADLRGNSALALDEAGARLYVVCQKPARLVVLDTATGLVQACLPCSPGAEGVSWDAARRRIYVSGADGSVDVFSRGGEGGNEHTLLARIRTRPGSRTSLYSESTDRFYLASPPRILSAPQVYIYEPK